jgi:voltage-gated potassium channel
MGLRERLGDIIFETDTPVSRGFDVVVLWAILLSVLAVMLESVADIRSAYGGALRAIEWGFTALFTVEYLVRIYTARKRLRYLTSFFGIVDLLAVLPSYLSLFFVGSQYFIVIRGLRLLRVFRVLKLVRFLGEASILSRALRASREKIVVFLVAVLTIVVIIGSAMFLIEGAENGFTNIPVSVYWAIVTLTTVGFGDIIPQTPQGRFLAAIVMVLGYGIIAVPTGIVTTELARVSRETRELHVRDHCNTCGLEEHDEDARFCKRCGASLLAEA